MLSSTSHLEYLTVLSRFCLQSKFGYYITTQTLNIALITDGQKDKRTEIEIKMTN